MVQEIFTEMTGIQIGILVGVAIFFLSAATAIMLIVFREGERTGPFGLGLGFLSYLVNALGYATGFLALTIPLTGAVMLGWLVLNFPNARAWVREAIDKIELAVLDGFEWLKDRMSKRREYRKAVKRAKEKSAAEDTEPTPRKSSRKNITDDIFD